MGGGTPGPHRPGGLGCVPRTGTFSAPGVQSSCLGSVKKHNESLAGPGFVDTKPNRLAASTLVLSARFSGTS